MTRTLVIAAATTMNLLPIVSGPAVAADTDARAQVARILKEVGKIPQTTTYPGHCTRGCTVTELPTSPIKLACAPGFTPTRDCEPPRTETVQKILTFGPVSLILQGDVKYSDPIFDALPKEVYSASVLVQNCTTSYEKGASRYNKSFSVTLSNSTTVSNSVSNTNGFRFDVRGNIGSYGSVGGAFDYKETITNGISKTNGINQQWSDTNGIDVPNPKPKSAVLAQMRAVRGYVDLPFSVVALLDAPLERNDRGYKMLADVATPEKRTVEIKGTIHLSGISQSDTKFLDYPFDESECKIDPSATKLIDRPKKINQQMRTMKPSQVKPLVD